MHQASLAVVIAAFNGEATIAATLASISGGATEIIVVDDGSTDATTSIAESFAGVNLITQANAGPGAARNIGVDAASSEWIAFLDADDQWFPWTIGAIHHAIAAHPEAGFGLLTPLEFEDELQSPPPADPVSTLHDAAITPFTDNRGMPFLGAGALVIRRELFIRLGGFTDQCRFGEDLDLILRAAAESPMWILEQPYGFAYRRGAASLTADHRAGLDGMRFLLKQHAAGAYGTAEGNAAAVANFARPVAVALARGGQFSASLSLYQQLFGSSLAQRKLKFILGLPLLSVIGKLRPNGN